MRNNPHRSPTIDSIQEAPKTWADLIGQTFGRLTALGYTGQRSPHKQKLITCQCACGLYLSVLPSRLRSGNTKSCGCLATEWRLQQNQKMVVHGNARAGARSPEYTAWQSMISRCTNSNDYRFKWYGARGISVCVEWRESFEAFLVDVGPRPSRRHSLGRQENNGHYEPKNVVWQLPKEQIRNQRNTSYYEFEGKQVTLGELADRFSLPYDLILKRVERFKWTLERAVSTPVGKGGRTPTRKKSPRSRMREIWNRIKGRCFNPEADRYKDYGGRGITICDEWKDDFEAFYAAVGDPPSPLHTLDRENNNGNYEPGNMRWATAAEQNRNRRSTKHYELYGESRTLSEWAELAGIDYSTVKRRVLQHRWPLDEALGTPTGNLGRTAKVDRRSWGIS